MRDVPHIDLKKCRFKRICASCLFRLKCRDEMLGIPRYLAAFVAREIRELCRRWTGVCLVHLYEKACFFFKLDWWVIKLLGRFCAERKIHNHSFATERLCQVRRWELSCCLDILSLRFGFVSEMWKRGGGHGDSFGKYQISVWLMFKFVFFYLVVLTIYWIHSSPTTVFSFSQLRIHVELLTALLIIESTHDYLKHSWLLKALMTIQSSLDYWTSPDYWKLT